MLLQKKIINKFLTILAVCLVAISCSSGKVLPTAVNTTGGKIIFPVGYHRFNRNQALNFQLNRWYSIGYARFQDMEYVGKRIRNFSDWQREMLKIADLAVSEGRLLNAAFYYRAAEFFMTRSNPEKERLYDKFIQLFYTVFEKEQIEKHKIPYQGSFLPAVRLLPSKGKKKGTIVKFGGFDSFIEEFYSQMKHQAEQGYEVIAFDGPGQGAALKKYGLAFDYEWEKPVKAVLDYFDVDGVTLIGASMGGWLVIRAAAFEPRVKRVIVSAPVFDYTKGQTPEEIEAITNFMNNTSKERIEKMGGIHGWWANNLMYITQKDTPGDAFKVWMQLNEKNLHSELVKQDVLIMTGASDHFNRPEVHEMQVNALVNAKSVTPRVFTKAEHADNHCQVGNLPLAMEVAMKWIEEKS